MNKQVEATQFLKAPEVIKRSTLSRTTLWRLVRDGQFPTPYKIGPGSIAWKTSDYERWAADPENWTPEK